MKCQRKKFFRGSFNASPINRFINEMSNGASPRPLRPSDDMRGGGNTNNIINNNNNNNVVRNQRRMLPTFAAKNRIVAEIERNPSVIILGETGSGKTTQIPQYLYETRDCCGYVNIAITQPRRIAAITIAKRVAIEMNVQLGNEVGYSVRFDDVTSSSTRLKYMTDGLLLREALLDRLLLKYTHVILDEAHERTVQTDVLFAIVKSAQKERKQLGHQQLKIIIMSATMDVDNFSEYLDGSPVLYLEGRQYPVQIMYSKENQADYLFAVMVSVFQIHQENPLPGDILVFLTGQDEIDSVTKRMREISRTLPVDVPPVSIFALYASLPAAQQLLPFQPIAQGVRRVIVATNIAETSITLPGVKYVVDSGLFKARYYTPNSGLEVLKVQKVSKAQAWQRSGRAGRESSGICYRIYTEAQFTTFPDNPIPEIQRCSLASTILHLLVLGIDDILNFDFIDKPTPEAISSAIDQLELLGAVVKQDDDDDNVQLSCIGRQMSTFPVDPHLSRMILASKDLGCSDEIVTIIALMSVDSVTYTPQNKRDEAFATRRKFMSDDGDLMMLLKIFQAFKKAHNAKLWCQDHFLHLRNLKMADDIRRQLIDLCSRCDIEMQSCGSELSAVRRCLAQGLFMNSVELQPSQDYLTLWKRQLVHIHPSSCLFKTSKASYLIFSELVQTTKMYIRGLCAVEPEWLLETSPLFFKYAKMNHINHLKTKKP